MDYPELYIQKANFSIFEIYRRIERGDFIYDALFRRSTLGWTCEEKSELIESVILHLPIPSIYLAEESNGKYKIIDGQKRILTFYEYINQDFQLEKLDILSSYNGYYFEKLPIYIQRKIEDFQIPVMIVQKNTEAFLKFEIFKRVNRGATRLNTQQLLSFLYQDAELSFIERLAHDQYFINLTTARNVRNIKMDQLDDHYLVLRFLSFYINGYEEYPGDMKKFMIDTFFDYHLDHSINQLTEEFSCDFERTMKNIYTILGEEVFVIRGRFNYALFDVLTYSFSITNDRFLYDRRHEIVELLKTLYHDKDFVNSLVMNPSLRANVIYRFEIWLDHLNRLK